MARAAGPATALIAALLAAACAASERSSTPHEVGRSAGDDVATNVDNGVESAPKPDSAAHPTGEWRVLFDGSDLSEWRAGVFGEDPEFEVTERGVVLPQGVPLAGLTYTGTAPSGAYTLEIEATKEYGADFFLGVTFPVRDAHITLVLGGWGGVVCGLSCLDGEDASTNGTSTLRSFPNGKSSSVAIDVSDERIDVRIDGETLLECPLEGREISLRPEVEPSVPLGICSFATCTTLHHVRVREARPPDPPLDAPSPLR